MGSFRAGEPLVNHGNIFYKRLAEIRPKTTIFLWDLAIFFCLVLGRIGYAGSEAKKIKISTRYAAGTRLSYPALLRDLPELPGSGSVPHCLPFLRAVSWTPDSSDRAGQLILDLGRIAPTFFISGRLP